MARGQKRIEQLYAFVVLDPADNTEGLPAFADPRDGAPIPMVAADMKRVESMKPLAASMAQQMNVKITLCRFEVRTEIEEFG